MHHLSTGNERNSCSSSDAKKTNKKQISMYTTLYIYVYILITLESKQLNMFYGNWRLFRTICIPEQTGVRNCNNPVKWSVWYMGDKPLPNLCPPLLWTCISTTQYKYFLHAKIKWHLAWNIGAYTVYFIVFIYFC